MADPKIRIRRSSTPNKVPDTSQLQLGELAINTFDGKLYLEQDQTSGSGIATVIAVNPWNVGLGTLSYDTYFTAGNVGVGTTNPTQLLDVAGDIRLRGAIFDSNNTTGTANQVLVSNAGAGVTWTNLTAIPVGDANTLDGLDSTQFLRSDAADTKTGITTFSDNVILQSGLNVTGVVTATGFVGNLTGTATTATNVEVSQSGTQTDHFVMLAIDGSIDSAVRLDAGLKFHTGTNTLTITGDTIIGAGVSIVGVATASAFVGDGSGLTNLPGASVGVNTNTTDQAQIIPFTLGYGTTTGFGATNSFVFNPSTTRLGIGSDAPAYALDVVGDINSSTDVKINGTGVLDTALALAIALG